MNEKTIDWPQVATFFDARSPVDQVPWGRWRYVLNMRQDDRYGWGRRCGFLRFGTGMRQPDNADLNDRENASEEITSLFSHQRPNGGRVLFAGITGVGTTHVYSQYSDGRWRCLGDASKGERWQFAGLNDVVLLSNNRDVVKYHVVGERLDSDDQAMHAVQGLQDVGVSTAGFLGSWKGCVFVGDVVMDGVPVGHRLLWSDINDPLSFVPSTSSIAGFQDLEPGERILSALALGDAYFIFTNQSIWRVTSVGGDEAFAFQQVYHNRDGEGCLRGRHTLAQVNGSAVYLSHDSVYVFSPFGAAPEKPEWALRATKDLVVNSEMGRCNQFSAVYHHLTEEFWISYVPAGQSYPTKTLCLNFRSQTADEIDHGFMAMLSAVVDTSTTVAEWMVSLLGCSSAHLESLWPTDREDPYPTAAGATVEWDSVCAVDDFIPACPKCTDLSTLILVSTSDGLLKQMDLDTYGRELRTDTNPNVYAMAGYPSRFVTGSMNFGTQDWKRLSEVSVSFQAPASDTPRYLSLKVGVSAVPADLMDDHRCFTKVFTFSNRTLACPSTAASGVLPNSHTRWPVLVEGRYLAFDFRIAAEADGQTGGSCWLSRISATVGKSPNTSQ